MAVGTGAALLVIDAGEGAVFFEYDGWGIGLYVSSVPSIEYNPLRSRPCPLNRSEGFLVTLFSFCCVKSISVVQPSCWGILAETSNQFLFCYTVKTRVYTQSSFQPLG